MNTYQVIYGSFDQLKAVHVEANGFNIVNGSAIFFNTNGKAKEEVAVFAPGYWGTIGKMAPEANTPTENTKEA